MAGDAAVPTGAAAALHVNASDLLRQPGTVRRVVACVPLAELGVADPHLAGDVAVDVELASTLDDVVVTGTLGVAWSDQCRRCLRPVAADLRIDVEERYAPVAPRAPGTADPNAFPIHGGHLDLTPMAREEVLLGVPDAPLCREDCAGLCPNCGADRNDGACDCPPAPRDERWAVLDNLRIGAPE